MNRRGFLAGAMAMAAGATVRGEDLHGAKAISGSRFIIGGQEFLLTDIIAPSAFTLHKTAQVHFAASKAALQLLLQNAALTITDAAPKTRWDVRMVVARRNGEERTLQEALIGAGAARVAPQTDNLEFVDRLLTLENGARADRRGLWALREYKIYDADYANGAVGVFQLVEGTVMRAAKAGGRTYLNFGKDYRDDFTASARNALARKWSKTGIDLAALEGRRLRVRGFVDDINGPSIDLQHIKQIEIPD